MTLFNEFKNSESFKFVAISVLPVLRAHAVEPV